MVDAISLQAISFFKGFDPSDVEAVAKLVARGQVKIYRVALQGKEQTLCIMGPGTCFGGCPLFDADFYPATAQAVTDLTLYILPRPTALFIAQQNPAVARSLLRVFAGRLRTLSHLAEGTVFNCVAGRLADALLEWSNERGKATAHGVRVYLPVALDDLASHLGTSPQVVSRAFLRLERLGAIEARNRRITILNRDLLCQFATKV